MLRYVGQLGLYPQTEIEVVEAAPYRGGPVTVRLAGASGDALRIIGDRAATAVRVTVD